MRRMAMGGIAALFAFTSLVTIAPPAPTVAAGAGSSCTGWQSRRTPPRSIRVLLTRSGRVVTVPFRTYVTKVMASGEWPSRLPMAMLVAGGFAVKQYAWYYTLKGNHRSWYRTRAGVCYDVRNDTNDQLFYREATPTKRQKEAVDRLWYTSLRRSDRFILTGYRAASFSRLCGRDADGWHLFARSATHCALRSLNGKEILRRYYGRWRVEFVQPKWLG
jgi:hypothetical protein